MEIVFIRHGQTDLNKNNEIQGAAVDFPLNQAGEAFAKKSAENFDVSGYDAVYVSPLKRAKQTAEIFVKNQKKLIIDQRLIEFDYGEWDGKLLSQMRQEHPDAIDPWGKVNQNYIKYAKHGESFTDLKKRSNDFLNMVKSKYPNGKVLVVAHGTLIRMMVAASLTEGEINNFETMDNCGLAQISYREGIARLDFYNRLLA